MKENQISFTAMMTAYIRGIHSKYANHKIFNDFLAYELVPEEQKINREDYAKRSLNEFYSLYHPFSIHRRLFYEGVSTTF